MSCINETGNSLEGGGRGQKGEWKQANNTQSFSFMMPVLDDLKIDLLSRWIDVPVAKLILGYCCDCFFPSQLRSLHTFCISPDGRHLFVMEWGFHHILEHICLETLTVVQTLEITDMVHPSMEFTPDSRFLIVPSSGQIGRYDLSAKQWSARESLTGLCHFPSCISSDSLFLFILVRETNTIQQWSIRSLTLIHEIPMYDTVSQLLLLTNPQTLLVALDNPNRTSASFKRIELLGQRTATVYTHTVEKDHWFQMILTPSEEYIFWNSWNRLWQWSVSSCQAQPYASKVDALAITPDSQHLLTLHSKQHKVCQWKVEPRLKFIRQFFIHKIHDYRGFCCLGNDSFCYLAQVKSQWGVQRVLFQEFIDG